VAAGRRSLTVRLVRPSSHSARPARARRAASNRATRCGETDGDNRVGKGEGARKGGTSGGAPRLWRDDGAVGSARDGGVPVEGQLR
jgi:hypothetical protein